MVISVYSLMGLEHWFETHVFLTTVGAFVLGSLVIGPLSTDLRAFYGKLPSGWRAARLAYYESRVAELERCRKDPTFVVIAALKTGCTFLAMGGLEIFTFSVIKNRNITNPLPGPTLFHLEEHGRHTDFLVTCVFFYVSFSAFASLAAIVRRSTPDLSMDRLLTKIISLTTRD